jgi:hypothetical protein
VHKGDVLGVARIAGIMAAKRASSLIPLCHSLPIEKAAVDFSFDEAERSVTAICTVKTTGKTGAEMEALTGASVAQTITDYVLNRQGFFACECMNRKIGRMTNPPPHHGNIIPANIIPAKKPQSNRQMA